MGQVPHADQLSAMIYGDPASVQGGGGTRNPSGAPDEPGELPEVPIRAGLTQALPMLALGETLCSAPPSKSHTRTPPSPTAAICLTSGPNTISVACTCGVLDNSTDQAIAPVASNVDCRTSVDR